MSVIVARRLDEALAALAEEPDAHVLAGGTDLMVEVNHGHRRPPAIVSVGRVGELQGWSVQADGGLRIGAGATYTELMNLRERAPALAAASRTVGSPQIRNAGTIGGNLGTSSPAGDTLPVLAALDATVVLASAGGERRMPIADFITGPKRNAARPGELIVEVVIPPVGAGHFQDYLKVGTRNAMVIAVASLALVVTPERIGVGLGSVGPVPLRAPEAEAWADAHRDDLDQPEALDHFGAMVRDAARPIDDHRSTADYRRHAVGVLARRAMARARMAA